MTAGVAARPPSVLIVDDEAQILAALKRSLRREGYEIVAVESAAAALRVLEERPVDVVLSDHKMPGLSGLQLLGRVAERWPEVLRMLITGWTDEIPRARLEAVGICALVTKPWDDARLKATLRAALAGERGASPRAGGSSTRDRSSDYSLRR